MHHLVADRIKGEFKIGIKRIHDKIIDIPHVYGPLELSTASIETGIVKHLQPDALRIILDLAIEGNDFGLGHLEVKVREYDEEIVFVLMGLEKLFSYHLTWNMIVGAIGIIC